MKKTGLIILAAGNASRMGKPKQLLAIGQQSLLEHALQEGQLAVGERLIVVLGAYQQSIQEGINHTGWRVAINEDWESGMASSIRAGMQQLLRDFPDTEQVILAVADQPHITAGLFQRLGQLRLNSAKGIVACQYADTQGVPVLFDRIYFDKLQALSGKQGAKKLIQQYSTDVAVQDFPEGAIDLDTPQDYAQFCAGIINTKMHG